MTVYAVQLQMKFDFETKSLVPRFPSVAKASSWGEVVHILPPDSHPFDTELTLGHIHSKLKDFSDDDYLLLIGNPTLIGMASAVAAHYNNGNVRFLQWNSHHSEYYAISAKIY